MVRAMTTVNPKWVASRLANTALRSGAQPFTPQAFARAAGEIAAEVGRRQAVEVAQPRGEPQVSGEEAQKGRHIPSIGVHGVARCPPFVGQPSLPVLDGGDHGRPAPSPQ